MIYCGKLIAGDMEISRSQHLGKKIVFIVVVFDYYLGSANSA